MILLRQGHERDGHENQNEDNDHREGNQPSGGVEGGDLIQWLSVDPSQPEQQHSPEPPSAPEYAQHNQQADDKWKRFFRLVAKQGIDHMSAVKRAGRDQVERRDQNPRPACKRNGMDEHIQAAKGDGATREEILQPVQNPLWCGWGRQKLTECHKFCEKIKQRVAFEEASWVWLNRPQCGEFQTQKQNRDRHHQPGNGARHANIKKNALVLWNATHENRRSHRPQWAEREGNEIRQCGGGLVMAAHEIVPQFMRQ